MPDVPLHPPNVAAAAPVTIAPVDTSRELRLFLRLPRVLYAGLPGFVPALDLERRGLLHPKHAPFFRHGRARYFLARRGDHVVGRISAQIDPVATAKWGENIGLFGALDAIDDAAVVARLLDAAAVWLRGETVDRMRGPYTLSANGESGLLVQGHQARPMVMSPWHPPYLGPLLEAAGCAKVKDLLSYDLAIGPAAEAAHPVPRMQLHRSDTAETAAGAGAAPVGRGLTTRGMRPRALAADAAILRDLFNDAWDDNWGFVPITADEVAAMVKEMKPLLHRDHFVVVEQAGEPVAMALIVPNLYEAVGDLGGAPSPLGWARLAWRIARRRFPSARVILLGVRRSVRGTTLGAMLPSLVIAELMKRGRTLPHRNVELGWVLEDNTRMRRLIERLSPEPSKVFRLYERAL